MAIFLRRVGYIFSRSQTLGLVFFKRSNCTLAMGDMDRNSVMPPVDTSKWRTVSANVFGIKRSMISPSAWTVLKILRSQGFDVYLVGGCVRDLILQRVPKDFDVITTANLKEIQRQFHRSEVVGKRFPICHVWIRGSITEVSSFDTVAQTASEDGEGKDSFTQNAEENEEHALPKVPHGYSEKDINRWRNSMQRDFAVNSLFFDPFDFKIYDYNNGIEDLKALKLRTLIPAQLSFEEDCVRILRGVRIAARLDLSFSNDIGIAIPKFVSSIASVDPFRLTMEMNYMLSYGAAGPSILLLRKFDLLQPLLPFQAAYLEEASKTSPLSSTLLMRLFSNMDKLVVCDQPADCRLWIALLAFHTALVCDPQDALVVTAFGSLLYHGHWKEAVRYVREHETLLAKFAPEVSETSENMSDEDLAEAVAQFTFLLKNSINVLTEMEGLQEALSLYPDSKCSGRVFIPENKAREVAEAFDDLVMNIEPCESKREGSITYLFLGKGDPRDIRFVLGTIILDTMIECAIEQTEVVDKNNVTNMQHVAASTNVNDRSTLINLVKNPNQSWFGRHIEHDLDASIPEPKQETSKRLEQEEAMNNQEAVASPICDLLMSIKQMEHKVQTEDFLSKLIHRLAGRLNATMNDERSSKAKNGKSVSFKKNERTSNQLAIGKLSSLFK